MRIGKIELMRFLGAVLIMNAHFGYQDRPFQLSWFFVEFFYIITGYFTMRHFEKQEPQEHFEAVKIAVEYTGKKVCTVSPVYYGSDIDYIYCYELALYRRRCIWKLHTVI